MSVSKNDRDILRELARQLAEIAALPIQQQTIALWKASNGLKPVRPMVMIDQIPWHEMDVDGELTLRTQDDFARGFETDLRRTLYRWKHMRADMVVEAFIGIPKVFHTDGFGITVEENQSIGDPSNDVVGHYYLDQLKTPEDAEKIRTPHITPDIKATRELQAKAQEIFDGILPVRAVGVSTMFNLWDTLVCWHGVENVLVDLVDRPEFMHTVMSRLTNAYVGMVDQLEAHGLLEPAQSTIHCTGAFSDELPAPGFNPEKPRTRDTWTCGMAQVFSSVSPAMHQEFELDYVNKAYERFGLVYYGCCEPLDGKIDIVRKVPHVRKISMSPWVDVERAAEGIGRDFVFSRKPSPAFLAPDTFDPKAGEKRLRMTRDACTRHGCPLEFILKDISTVRYQPQRLWQWSDIAMRVAQG